MRNIGKKWKAILLMVGMVLLLTGCNIQIFEHEEEKVVKEVSDDRLKQNTFYIKNVTKFAEVYKPYANFTSAAKTVDTKRLIFLTDDEGMIPVHYKGEIAAYSSGSADLKSVTLERYKDLGYSIGIYGGVLKEDGYYHISASDNVVEGSQVQELFSKLSTDEIRIKSVGGVEIGELLEKRCGVIQQLDKDDEYFMEFYAGTYYYRAKFKADIHFLQAFELYPYGANTIEDTKNGYMCFNTPTDLKSGYYNINGGGIFLYHAYARGEVVEDENYNEGYYENEAQMIATYSKQYDISIAQNTYDVKIKIAYGSISDGSEMSLSKAGYVVAPDQTVYYMDVDEKSRTMTLALKAAQAGDWKVHITPKSLEIADIGVYGDTVKEDTVCEEVEFEVDEDKTFQMFYADISGKGDVYGSIIAEDGITYNLEEYAYKDENKVERRYLAYKLPYLRAGKYKVKIYYYQSQTSVHNVTLKAYNDETVDIIVIE